MAKKRQEKRFAMLQDTEINDVEAVEESEQQLIKNDLLDKNIIFLFAIFIISVTLSFELSKIWRGTILIES